MEIGQLFLTRVRYDNLAMQTIYSHHVSSSSDFCSALPDTVIPGFTVMRDFPVNMGHTKLDSTAYVGPFSVWLVFQARGWWAVTGGSISLSNYYGEGQSQFPVPRSTFGIIWQLCTKYPLLMIRCEIHTVNTEIC